MRIGYGIAALLPLLAALPAAPVSAQGSTCRVHEERDGVRATLTQTYFGQDGVSSRPIQKVSALVGRGSFYASSYPHWRTLDTPFAPPREIILGIPLPERAASGRITLYASGAVPITLRARIYRDQPGEQGLGIELRDPARIRALLSFPNWTVIVRHRDGRVQQIVAFRMPMTLDRLRALRDSQVARLREMARDPGRNCDVDEDKRRSVALADRALVSNRKSNSRRPPFIRDPSVDEEWVGVRDRPLLDGVCLCFLSFRPASGSPAASPLRRPRPYDHAGGGAGGEAAESSCWPAARSR